MIKIDIHIPPKVKTLLIYKMEFFRAQLRSMLFTINFVLAKYHIVEHITRVFVQQNELSVQSKTFSGSVQARLISDHVIQ